MEQTELTQVIPNMDFNAMCSQTFQSKESSITENDNATLISHRSNAKRHQHPLRIEVFLVRELMNVQQTNIQDIVLENKMLSKSLEKYKKLYFDMCNGSRAHDKHCENTDNFNMTNDRVFEHI